MRNKGFKHSKETIEKIRAKRMGFVWSPEIKKKMSLAKIGKKHTKEHNNKIGRSGEKNGMWRGGISRAYKTGYYSVEYKNWRKAVFERDDFQCQECGAIGYITAHHIKSFTKHPDLRFVVENGLTLCEECHSKTDNYKGRANRKIL